MTESFAQRSRQIALVSLALAVVAIAVLALDKPTVNADAGAVIDRDCAISSEGGIVCWSTNRRVNERIPAEGTFTEVSGSGNLHCALTADGGLSCWAQSVSTCCGARQPSGSSFVAVSVNGPVACAVTSSGGLVCGSANGRAVSKMGPVPFGRFTQVSVGNSNTQDPHACALTTTGSVLCWGHNEKGQTDAPEGSYVQISVLGETSCALTSDGRIDCWGSNDLGRANAPEDANYAAINLRGHPCAITKQGGIVCWGTEGTEVIAESGYTFVNRSGNRLCAVTTDGALECFGDASRQPPAELTQPGALRLPPVVVSGPAGSTGGISASATHRATAAVRLEGPSGGRVTTTARDVDSGGEVTFTANPDPGYRFVRWEGDASGTRNPITLTLFSHAFVTALFAPVEAPSVSTPATGDGRIIARLLADDRIEFGFEPEGGERVLPRSRYFPANAGGSWLVSSDVELNGERLGRITARRLADGRVEFGFIPTDGERILPSSRYFPTSSRVDRWLRSSVIGVK